MCFSGRVVFAYGQNKTCKGNIKIPQTYLRGRFHFNFKQTYIFNETRINLKIISRYKYTHKLFVYKLICIFAIFPAATCNFKFQIHNEHVTLLNY